MEKIEHENLKNIFIQLDGQLSQIEVKGSSVENLYNARKIISDLFRNIKTEEEKIDKEE